MSILLKKANIRFEPSKAANKQIDKTIMTQN